MIKSGVSHSLLSLLLLFYTNVLLASAERIMAISQTMLLQLVPGHILQWLGSYPAQTTLLALAAFCWGVLHHHFFHGTNRGPK